MIVVRSVAPPYGDVVVVVEVEVGVVVDGTVVVAGVVSVGNVVDVEVVVSPPPDEHAASASASAAVNARPRRYLIGTPLSPMPPRISVDRTRRRTDHAHRKTIPRVGDLVYGAASPRNVANGPGLPFCGLRAAHTRSPTLGCGPSIMWRGRPADWVG